MSRVNSADCIDFTINGNGTLAPLSAEVTTQDRKRGYISEDIFKHCLSYSIIISNE